ncbi:MAG: hypothetical protein M1337_06350 [Actinobacteria bacterium]|nr:hypothetical protein [Actinomycetota bacterium]
MSETSNINGLIGQRVNLSGHFDEPVVVEALRPLGESYELRVRRSTGQLEEAVLSADELAGIVAASVTPALATPAADPEQLRLLVESARIRLAYAYDSRFAVSLSGIRTLPHQIEAVYLKMLPQPRLRFLLAEKAGRVTLTVEASKADGFDKDWLRNAVYEPLEEQGIEVEEGTP